MPRPVPWKPLALATTATTILLSLLLLPACCCVKAPVIPMTAPAAAAPAIGTVDFLLPDAARAKEPTQAEMHNVDFHVDAITILNIHELRGEMVAKQPGEPVNFDNKLAFILKVDTARIGMKTPSLDSLMNRYVFAQPDAPLRSLNITFDGKQMKQEGVIHKIVDIPFTMWADVSADAGRLRIHPTKIDICGINGLGLLKAVGQNLEKMIGKQLPQDKA